VRQSNYDKHPFVQVEEVNHCCFEGWQAIGAELNTVLKSFNKKLTILVIECYTGVLDEDVVPQLQKNIRHQLWVNAKDAFKDESFIRQMIYPDVTDDRVFGFLTRLTIEDYFSTAKIEGIRKSAATISEGVIVVYGTGASLLLPNFDVLIYADMARWEIQMRMRRNEINNLGVTNKHDEFSQKYKHGFFVDWRVCDRLKKKLFSQWNYLLDTNDKRHSKLVTADAIKKGFQITVQQPFRVVPFFDPGPWGGQWMKEVCGLDRSAINYAWCFDCVPEENSLLLAFGEVKVEIPSVDLVFFQTEKLLGAKVYARFGAEFPIRFDFLDTMGGGNLSLQVHPLTEYIQQQFGMHYTQDESYYILDAGEDAQVYLGLKTSNNMGEFFTELEQAQNGIADFNAEKYVATWPVKKHDHVSIPAGTVHCSGANTMVLEISATPYIFTFKLWDWNRLGLDGKPRPIHLQHGKNVLQQNRDANWVKQCALNLTKRISSGDGWREESTGLNELEFIETRRHWFTKKVDHHTNGIVHVLNLVEGREIMVESTKNLFPPFIVHYAETFIVPAAVGTYSIRPHGEAEGTECATIKAYVRC
jgi:mannose-6-phosphate isomerase class I